MKQLIKSRFFIFLIFAIFCNKLAYSQVTLDVKYKKQGEYSYPVILPSMQNLIALANCDVNTLKETMKKYRYSPCQDY